MKKVLFAYYPLKIHYNHGVALLSSILEAKGIKVYVLEIDQLLDIKKPIKELEIDFIGFSIVTSQEYIYCLPHMIEAKKMEIPVLVGGIYPRRGAFIDPAGYDYVCRGEGEILGDFILNGKTEVFDSPYLHENLDNLPMPDINHLTGYEFDRDIHFLKGLRIIPYHSSRGCPHLCSFCEVRFQPQKIRIKSTIRQDMDFLAKKFNPDLFHIMDELLPYYNENWVETFDGNPYPFLCYIRPDIKGDQLKFLIDNGLKITIFGVESGDENYRNEVLKKNVLDADIYRTAGMLQAHGILYVPFYMYGTPFETEEMVRKTIGMARGVGGHPIIWKYEDLEKRVFSIEPKLLERYSKRIKMSKESVMETLNDVSVNVISNIYGFLAYQLSSSGLFIRDIYGDGSYWSQKLIELCKEFGMKKYYGSMRKNFGSKFNEKYGLREYNSIIGREV